MFRIYLENFDYMNDHFYEKNLPRIFRRIHTQLLITVINIWKVIIFKSAPIIAKFKLSS